MGERHSKKKRADHDWYVEEEWNVHRLFDRVNFNGAIHDPCCGIGTIVKVARKRKHKATGSDIVRRKRGFTVANFLLSTAPRDNIVMNPPYKIGHQMIKHALKVARHRVAAIMPIKFLAGQARHWTFRDVRMEKVIIFSRRPNMPPGEELAKHGEEIRGGGSTDYCWVIWNRNKDWEGVEIEWTM